MRPSRTFTPQTAQHAHQPLNATQNAAQRVMNAHVHRRVNARGHNSVQEKCGATARNASQPARRATQETRATHGRKAKRRRAGRRSATKPHNLHHRKQRGEKGSRRDSHPDPHHQSNVHTQPCGGSARQRRSEVMTLNRRPVAALTIKLHEQATTSIQLSRVPPAVVEPATIRLRVGCSDHLSYGGFIFARFRRDSNPQPPAPEAGALSIELRKQNIRYEIILCPRQESNLCSPGFNRKLLPN